MPSNAPTSEPPRAGNGRGGVVVAVVFFVLAGWFLVGPDFAKIPRREPTMVKRSSLSVDPRRRMQSDPPIVHAGGFDRHCMECHRFFEPDRRESARQLVQHTHIVLDHGLNDRCLNCHDRINANRLILRGEKTVPFSQSARLCAKCHGPTYRDWQHGMHGKTVGYWDGSSGNPRRFTCVECHDPHAPAFPPMKPLPGPHTLRMVLVPPRGGEHEPAVDQVDPLRKWHYDKPKRHPPVELPPVPLGGATDQSEKGGDE